MSKSVAHGCSGRASKKNHKFSSDLKHGKRLVAKVISELKSVSGLQIFPKLAPV